jgi:two-component system sensor histidine kinase ChvG
VVTPEGRVVIDHDHHLGEGVLYLWRTLLAWAFGPDQVPSLRDFDSTLGAFTARPEFVKALGGEDDTGCRYSTGRKLQVCHYAAGLKEGAGVVYAQARTQRTIRALYDYRFQYFKLMLYNVVLGLLLAWWMSRSILQPVHDLRSQVLTRADFAQYGAGLKLDRRDELGALTEAFNALLAALSARAKANEEFLSDLAHEFKNPVAAVRTCAENLADTDGIDKDKAARISKILSNSSARLDALLNEFLELARAEAGMPGEKREAVDVGLLAGNVCDSVRQDERYRDREITFVSVDGSLTVEGVARRLEMALRNLIDNGAAFAGSGGRVDVRVGREQDQVVITVSDNGPGITAEHLPRVFERFFTTRGEKLGTGLGLAITRATIEAHGGKVRAESESGKGAVFVVHLPLTQ